MAVTFYEVRDRAGTVVAIHKRVDHGDGSKELKWLRPDGQSGLGGRPTADLPLYGAHLLDGWASDATVVVAEGEKAADALVAAGVPAVATVCGASATPAAGSLADLTGRHVALWPDNDDAGRDHMTRVGAALYGTATSIRWVSWRDAPAKGDAADYLATAAGAADPWAEVDAADPWLPPGVPLRGRDYWYAADIDVPDVAAPMALWPFLLDEGDAVLFGDGDVGKSALAQLVGSSIATGRSDLIADHTAAVNGPVLWADWEASRLRFARRQRLIEIAAPLIYVPCARPVWDEAERLATIVEREGVEALVVDSIIPATSGSGIRDDAERAGRFFSAVGAIARRSLSLGHVTKNGRDDDKPFGSAFFHNLSRLTWRIRREADEDRHSVRLTNHKHNDGERIAPFYLELTWDGRLRAVPGLIHPLTPETMAELVDEIGGPDSTGVRRADIERHLADDPRRVGATRLTQLLTDAVAAGYLERVRQGVYRRPGGKTGGKPGFGLADG